MLQYAILNGLREDLEKYVIQKQPADMNALLEAARVGEICYPANNTESNAEVTTQLTALQEQLRHLSLKIDTPMVSSATDGGGMTGLLVRPHPVGLALQMTVDHVEMIVVSVATVATVEMGYKRAYSFCSYPPFMALNGL